MLCGNLTCFNEPPDKAVQSADLVQHPDMNTNPCWKSCILNHSEISIKIMRMSIVLVLAVNQFQRLVIKYFLDVFIQHNYL